MKAILVGICVIFLLAASGWAADYYVDALSGSNKGGNGSLKSPWKTITFSLTRLTVNDTLHVMPGTYNTSGNREVYPLTLPAGITLIGSSARDCILDAEGNTSAARVLNVSTGCTVAHLTVKGSNNGWWDAAIASWGTNTDWKVLNCTIEGKARGIHVWNNNKNVLIAGNYFSNCYNDNISVYSSTNVDIFSNTFDGTLLKGLKGIIITSNGTVPSTGRIYNNTITNFTQLGIDADAATGKGVTLDYNNIWNNVLNYSPNLTKGQNDISVDPVFVNATTGNLHIAPTSPLVDKGIGTYTYITDWDGTPRPQGTTVDIGADELVYESNAAAIVDFHIFNQPAPGATLDFVVLGVPKDAGAFAISLLQQNPPVPLPVGLLHLNLGTFLFFLPVGLDARGVSRFGFPIPNVPGLVGLSLYTQAYSGKWMTRYETIYIR